MHINYYSLILNIHSYWRWWVLCCAVAAVGIGVVGLAARLPFVSLGREVSRLFIIAVDVQLVLGLCLYGISPIVRSAWSNMASAMKQHDLRYFAVEHLTTMLLGVGVAHFGSWRCKRASEDRTKWLAMSGWYATSLVIFLVGIPWWRPWFRH